MAAGDRGGEGGQHLGDRLVEREKPVAALVANHQQVAETRGGEITTGGTSELPMRNQYRSWARYMTETM